MTTELLRDMKAAGLGHCLNGLAALLQGESRDLLEFREPTPANLRLATETANVAAMARRLAETYAALKVA